MRKLLILLISIFILNSKIYPNNKFNIVITHTIFKKNSIFKSTGVFVGNFILYDIRNSFDYNDIVIDIGNNFRNSVFNFFSNEFYSKIYSFYELSGVDGICLNYDEYELLDSKTFYKMLPIFFGPITKFKTPFFNRYFTKSLLLNDVYFKINIFVMPHLTNFLKDDKKEIVSSFNNFLNDKCNYKIIISDNTINETNNFLKENKLSIATIPLIVFDSTIANEGIIKQDSIIFYNIKNFDGYTTLKFLSDGQNIGLSSIEKTNFVVKKGYIEKNIDNFFFFQKKSFKINSTEYYPELAKIIQEQIKRKISKKDEEIYKKLNHFSQNDFFKLLSIFLSTKIKYEFLLLNYNDFNTSFFKDTTQFLSRMPLPRSAFLNISDLLLRLKINGKKLKTLINNKKYFVYKINKASIKDNELYSILIDKNIYKSEFSSPEEVKDIKVYKNLIDEFINNLKMSDQNLVENKLSYLKWRIDPAIIQFKVNTVNNVNNYSNFPGEKQKNVSLEFENKFYLNLEMDFMNINFYHYFNYEKSRLNNINDLFKYSIPVSNLMTYEITLSNFIKHKNFKSAIFLVSFKAPVERFKNRADFKSWNEKFGFEFKRNKLSVIPGLTCYQPVENIKKSELGLSVRLKLNELTLPYLKLFSFYFQSDIEKYFTGKETFKSINEFAFKTKLSTLFFLEFNIKNTIFKEKRIKQFAYANYYNLKIVFPIAGKIILGSTSN